MPFTEEQLNTPAEPGSLLASIQALAKEQSQPVLEPEPEPQIPPEPVVIVSPAPAPIVETNEPKVFDFGDGKSLTIEHSSRGWKGTIESGSGSAPEVFYGPTKEEMHINIGKSAAHGTAKIREQARKLKLGIGTEAPATPQTPVTKPVRRELTADEQMLIKTQFAADPIAALDALIEKRYGQSLDKIVQKTDDGTVARLEQIQEQGAREFVADYPLYHKTESNYEAIVGLLTKKYLRKELTDANRNESITNLTAKGFWTAANLGAAYEELSEAGLMEIAPVPRVQPTPPVAPEPTPAPVAPVVETPRPNERIVRTETRPRAGYGLRESETSSSYTPAADQPPSAKEIASMSDTDIADLFSAIRADRAKQTRR